MALDNQRIELFFPSLTGDARYRHVDFIPLLHHVEGKCILDVGSHCGHLTLEISRFNPKWLLCVEPFHSAAEVLEKQVLATLPFPTSCMRTSMNSPILLASLENLGGLRYLYIVSRLAISF
jgi:predicted RNA methylase